MTQLEIKRSADFATVRIFENLANHRKTLESLKAHSDPNVLTALFLLLDEIEKEADSFEIDFLKLRDKQFALVCLISLLIRFERLAKQYA